jgi:transposase-like protein
MASVLNAPYFQDETEAYAKLESLVWPNGPVCPHCGCADRMKKMGGAATRPGLYKCYGCRKQSRVTVGTVFESSHIKLHVWLQAAYLMCSSKMCASKKGISSNQLARVLGLTVKSAWFMSHRLREAMAAGKLPPMGGEGAVVEIDETFIGTKEGAEVKRGFRHKNAILTLVERGGSARSFHVDGTTAKDLLPIIKANVHPDSIVMTDEAMQYTRLAKHFTAHGTTNHGAGEYVEYALSGGFVHSNTVEGFYSVFKRGMKGIYQHCSEKHLHRYVAEFDFRYNNRIKLGVDDAARTDNALAGIVGKRLTYGGPKAG